MLKKIAFCSICLLVLLQQPYSQPPTQAKEFIPALLPPSPEAASFAKFGNYQVNLFTGLPDINIPLYEIKVGEMVVPISISYHPSGLKVSSLGSWVGMGWNLNAGGYITRKVMGLPDDQGSNYLSGINPVRDVSTLDLNTDADLYYIRNVHKGIIDAEPDIFSYNFYGKSGQFVFNQVDSYKPILIPYDPISVSFSGGVFDIKNESGVTYQFHNSEYTQYYNPNGPTIQGISSWPLSRMVSANNQDMINFSYSASDLALVSNDLSETFVLNDNVTNISPPNSYSADMGTGWQTTCQASTRELKIQQITFPNGKIVFDASPADRLDAFAVGQKSLADIKIYALDVNTNTYSLTKSIIFYQSYFVNSFDNSIKRLRLDAIGITDNNGTVIEKYTFNYNTAVELPAHLSNAIDYWGYYNGKTSNTTLIPQITQVPYQATSGSTPSFITIGSTDPNSRQPDPAFMQAYMLKTINFPSGGHTDFEFESNQYLDASSVAQYAGGLRIKTIKSYDGANPNPIVKSYKYGTGESGFGRANFKIGSSFFQTTQTNQFYIRGTGCDILTDSKRVRVYVSSPSIDLEPYDGTPVTYATVTEYIGDPVTNIGKTIYTFNDRPDGLNTTIITGKPIITTYYEHRGQLIDKQVYKYLGPNNYQIVEETQNNYTAYPEKFYPNLGIVVTKRIISDNNYIGNDVALPSHNSAGACNQTDSYNFQYISYSIRTDDNKLTQTINTSYNQSDPTKTLVTTTNYYYDNLSNLQVTRIITTNSKGDAITTIRKYPHDFSATVPYNTMIAANNIDKVVQEQKLKNGSQQLTLQNNNYLDKGNGNYLVDNITYQVAGNPVETRALFTSYDPRGNVSEMQKAGDIKMSIIWDYQKIYPVAQVTNASQNDIAYTSFEGDGSGNWSFSGTSVVDPTAPTGRRCFTIGANITRLLPSPSAAYIVSYWVKSGTVTVNGTNPVTGRSVSGWTYCEHKIANPAGGLITVSGPNAIIDELRLYPATAQMTTYTYNPLVGMTSQCDVNNRITYYEYDGLQRLMLVRDQDRNVLKQICYNYAGQPENCSIVYNDAQQGFFTRQSCGQGTVPGTVTYTVPAGLYSAPTLALANALALNDVNGNGQAYANINAPCTPGITVNGYNASSSDYNVKFSNGTSSYTFLLTHGTTIPQYIGAIPAGTYDVIFFPAQAPVVAAFTIGQWTYSGGTAHTFPAVVINATITASIN